MKVAIDARSLSERFTSNRTYWFELIRELIPLAAEQQIELILITDRPIDASALPVLGTVRIIVAPALSSRLWSLFTFPKVCKREGADVAHVQYTVSPFSKTPTVTTIHDISYFIEPAWFGWKDRTLLRLSIPASIRRAAKVIAVSETSRQEMIDILKVDAAKIVATPLGVPSFCAAQPASGQPQTRGDSLLFVGGLNPRKNWQTAIEAVAAARAQWPELTLTITGPNRVDPEQLSQVLARTGAKEWLELPGGIPEEDLAARYRTALAVIHPSLHEGFGLTPLEAFACGCPVIASNRGAIPEVVGDAAILLDPTDAQAWTEAILTLKDPAKREDLIAKGAARAAHFRWSDTAAKTLDVYKSSVRKNIDK